MSDYISNSKHVKKGDIEISSEYKKAVRRNFISYIFTIIIVSTLFIGGVIYTLHLKVYANNHKDKIGIIYNKDELNINDEIVVSTDKTQFYDRILFLINYKEPYTAKIVALPYGNINNKVLDKGEYAIEHNKEIKIINIDNIYGIVEKK